MSELVGEVIASSTREWEVEVHRETTAPAFGTWVYIPAKEGGLLFGLVSHVEIGSYEPQRRAVALGKTQDQLQREMPQVMELLRTTFRAQVLAFQDEAGRVRQTLPPFPASIHAFVYQAPTEYVRLMGTPFDYLRTLVRNPDPAVPVDEMLVAVLSQVYTAFQEEREGERALLAAGRALGRLLNEDHERLQSILRRVERT